MTIALNIEYFTDLYYYRMSVHVMTSLLCELLQAIWLAEMPKPLLAATNNCQKEIKSVDC